MRVSTYARRYLLRAASLAPNTRGRYRSEIERHIIRRLGSMQLCNVTAATTQKFIAALLAAKIAPSTTRGIGKLLLRILAAAAAEEKNVTPIDSRRITWPREQRARRAPKSFTADEVDRIIAGASGWPKALFAVLGMVGLRISEGLGLDWIDVDLIGGALHVRQQASRGHLRALKSSTSRADLPLHPRLQTILADYWSEQGNPTSGLLFSRYGLPRSATGVADKQLRPLLRRLGIEHHGLHGFRHAYCRRLWTANVPAPVIMRLMRHGDLRTTLSYSETTADELRAGVVRVDWPQVRA
jgi:integrase